MYLFFFFFFFWPYCQVWEIFSCHFCNHFFIPTLPLLPFWDSRDPVAMTSSMGGLSRVSFEEDMQGWAALFSSLLCNSVCPSNIETMLSTHSYAPPTTTQFFTHGCHPKIIFLALHPVLNASSLSESLILLPNPIQVFFFSPL